MTRTHQTPPSARSHRGVLLAAVAVVVVAGTVGGITSALWRTELSSHAALADAEVLFSVNGKEATASNPAVEAALSTAQMQALLDDGSIAVSFEVHALSQGNRGLRYTVAAPETEETDILHWADLALFPVSDSASCTLDAEPPILPPRMSTPVAATYSDTTTPTIEYWCLRADLGELPDAGEFMTTATITGTHALGEIVETRTTTIDVTTAFTVANEPTHRVPFTYETFREGEGR